MPVITISRELGSLGSAIARSLGAHLELPLLDKAAVEQHLEEHGVPRQRSERFDEKLPGFWDRLSQSVDRYRHFLVSALLEAAQGGRCILVGRGGQIVLGGVPGVVHLRVTASPKTRLVRVMAREGCDERTASQAMRRSDQDRVGFVRFFFDADPTDCALYDLVLNTDVLDVAAAVALVSDLVRAPALRDHVARAEAVLADRCLAHRVRSALLYCTERPLYVLDVTAEGGVVTLTGSIPYREHIAHCVEVAQRVDGVREVVDHLRPGVPQGR